MDLYICKLVCCALFDAMAVETHSRSTVQTPDCQHEAACVIHECPLCLHMCSVWLEKKSSRLDVEKKQERKKAKAMEEELTWIRQGVRVRNTTLYNTCLLLHAGSKLSGVCCFVTISAGYHDCNAVWRRQVMQAFTCSVQGRQSKSKARVSAYEKLVTASEESRSRDKFQSGAIVIPPAPRLGECMR